MLAPTPGLSRLAAPFFASQLLGIHSWTLSSLDHIVLPTLRYQNAKNPMGLIRLELMTPSLSEKCSNHLSYSPKQ